MGDLINKKEVIERAEQCIFTDKNQKRQFIDWLEYCLEQPSVEAFPKLYVDQLRWERDIALEQLNEIGCDLGMDMTEIKQKLESVPVVYGEWINEYINPYGHPCHCCSVCGFHASYQDKNFCPDCGADMRKKA